MECDVFGYELRALVIDFSRAIHVSLCYILPQKLVRDIVLSQTGFWMPGLQYICYILRGA